MSTPDKILNEYSARLATFQTPHHLNKRRASNQSTNKKKKNVAGTVEWPHQFPSAEGLARAGFFYKPAHDSEDNVQCFTCNVKLDGWEPADDPISEHLAHSHGCAWATAISVIRDEDSQQPPEQRDPLSEEMAGARYATFTSADGWPHEGKKGWKCKVRKMVEAGWAWDPNDESEDRDGVTCFYCNLSLDGWEPKDDPLLEHKRREPACPFFALLEHYHGVEEADGKTTTTMKKGKARGKASARNSTASKASRMSVQSTISEVPSMAASFADVGMDGSGSLAGVDDSIITTATTTSQATKGRKKAVKAKATKGKKKASVEEDAMEVDYPELSQPEQHVAEGEKEVEEEDEIAIAPVKPTRKTNKTATKQLDSSVVEISQMDAAPKKAARGRKPKSQQQPVPEPEEIPQTPDTDAIAEKRMSEISAQLQDELDHTVDDSPLDQSTPVVVEIPKPKRGVKRTSDGARKQHSSDSSAFEVDVTVLPKVKPVEKAKRGRKPKQTSTASMEEDMHMGGEVEKIAEPAAKKSRGRPKGKKNSSARSSQAITTSLQAEAQPDELEMHQNEPQAVVKKGRGRPKGSKNSSSARSSQNSQTSVIVGASQSEQVESEVLDPQPPAWPHLPRPNPARDEMEIETELERIASEQAPSHQAMETEQNQIDEFETSPSQGRPSKDRAEIQQLEQELEKEKNINNHEIYPQKSADSPPPRLSLGLGGHDGNDGAGFTFSPGGSDKENSQPSHSISRPSSSSVAGVVVVEKEEEVRMFMSPTKTTRVPLAPGTPNHQQPRSPTRRMGTSSPSKTNISQLTSNNPWNPVDLDTILLGSDPESHTPGRVGQALVESLTRGGAGVLTEKEKVMSVEEWIRWRAEVVEVELRRKCEGMVACFEEQGVRGLRALEGVDVVG